MNFKDLFRRKPTQSGTTTLLSETSGNWKEIYSGGGDWRYRRRGGLDGGTRRVAAAGAAKSVAAEFAAMCFSEQADFFFQNEEVKAYVLGTLQREGFWRCFPLFLEKMFALGSGVVKTYIENDEVKLDFIGGDAFLPTQYDEKNVCGGIILSAIKDNGKTYTLAECHERAGESYFVINRLFDERDREIPVEELFPNLEIETEITNLKEPLFVYFRPASVDHVSGSPLGASVFANAVDTLRAIDTVLDSLEREFILGRKRIIVPTSALRGEYDENGVLKKFFDTTDEVWQAFSAEDGEELKVIDNSTELRVKEHTDALTFLFDLLCMQTGLSPGTFSYSSGTYRTATEVLTKGGKTYRTKTAHQQLIREGLTSVCRNIAVLGIMLGDLPADLNETSLSPEIVFADSTTADNSAKIDNTLKLFSAGLIDKERALAEIFGV
ncbi:MAG: phage portal protein [Oscillospiraceae bacterium]|jgi:A118 family predicted phage portal protein|nr:phage portal protein [Oscillospiraceae bacterium]